jgi:hypothetical protein
MWDLSNERIVGGEIASDIGQPMELQSFFRFSFASLLAYQSTTIEF